MSVQDVGADFIRSVSAVAESAADPPRIQSLLLFQTKRTLCLEIRGTGEQRGCFAAIRYAPLAQLVEHLQAPSGAAWDAPIARRFAAAAIDARVRRTGCASIPEFLANLEICTISSAGRAPDS